MAKTNTPEKGTKKYKDAVQKSNDFYDKHKAGKRDPKTGIVNNKIDFEKPSTRIAPGSPIGGFLCFSENCDHSFSVNRTTAGICCPHCKVYYSVKVNKLTDEIVVNGVLV